jgi:hypothetical protein
MKISSASKSLALFVLFLLIVGCAAPLKQTLPADAREVPGGRRLVVTVAQTEINALINTSNITAATGGGLLFALIDAGVNKSRTTTAEEKIAPIRNSLLDYNFDQKAFAMSKKLAENITWLGIIDSELKKDVSNAIYSKSLDESSTSQQLILNYDYLLTPAFDAIKVGARVSVLSKQVPSVDKPEDRALLKNAVFTRDVVCAVSLKEATKDADENIAKWSKDNGALARKSLDDALAALLKIIEFALNFTDDQAIALQSNKLTNVGSETGKVIRSDIDGTLLLNIFNQFSYVFNSGVTK